MDIKKSDNYSGEPSNSLMTYILYRDGKLSKIILMMGIGLGIGEIVMGVGMMMGSDELVVEDEVEAEKEDFLLLPISGSKFDGKVTPLPYPAIITSLSFPVD
jgi:hypothetical protein